MRFSFLLPTRNGGRFLRPCIESVLSQTYPDMELVISDNANSDETPEILESYRQDPRVRVIRMDEPVSVTDNWNATLQHATGDYFVMIGDDDYILPPYLATVTAALEQHNYPDCLVYNGYTYVFSDAIEPGSVSHFRDPHFQFGPEFRSGTLARGARLEMVRDMYRFQLRYPLNMQLTVVGRQVAERLRGGSFQPPFPDHLALSSLLLQATTFACIPDKIVVIGVSPKSFGHYAYGTGSAGMAYLGSSSHFPGALPGNDLVNSMYIWLDKLRALYGDVLDPIEINRADYVRRQVYHWCFGFRFGLLSPRDLGARLSALRLTDWVALASSPADRETRTQLMRILRRQKRTRAQYVGRRLAPLSDIDSITAFAHLVTTQQAITT